jgi:WhiB family redox-sensing transcriptional regulator
MLARTRPNVLVNLLDTPPAWQDLALCAEVGWDLFFVDKGMPTHEAREVCSLCEVRAECLAYALDHGEEGVWGGTSEYERRTMRPSPIAA